MKENMSWKGGQEKRRKQDMSWKGGQEKEENKSFKFLLEVLTKLGSFVDGYASTCECF